MIHIKKPKNNVEEIFNDCISNFRDADFKKRLNNVLPFIKFKSLEYDEKAKSSNLFELEITKCVNKKVTSSEMEKVYDQKLVKQGQPGRKHYEKLKLSAENGICPLCDHRTVTTLDHVLPKKQYPSYAITPLNLVPACGDCNKIKSTKKSTSNEDEVIHPYYDDISNKKYLFSKLIENKGSPSFIFYIKESKPVEVIEKRLINHLEMLELHELYTANSARTLAGKNYRLKKLFKEGGKESVREHLEEEYYSNFECNKNSWETAMYETMYKSDWFCNEGFLIDK